MPLGGLELGVGTWLVLVGLGGILALDGTGWPQSMASRPIVCATLGGWVMSDPAAGFLAGAVLELMALRHPPYGAARYPDAGPAGLAAGTAYAAAGVPGLLPLLTAVLGGWAMGWAGAHSVHFLRDVNGRLVGDPEYLAGRADRVERRHRLAMRLDVARGALLTAALLVPVMLVTHVASGIPPGTVAGSGWATVAAATGIAAIVAAGSRNLGSGRRSWPFLLTGVLFGVLVAAALRGWSTGF